MKIESITIQNGFGRDGQKDNFKEIKLNMCNIISIVGPTGSGKTTFINDIALFADKNTPSGRRILINNEIPSDEFMNNPSCNPISYITQHTNFLSDLSVKAFLETHIKIRNSGAIDIIMEKTLDFANQITGEPIIIWSKMTELSGGQTRALLIADAVIIGNSPIILLDEIENAGINRTKALELLRNYEKIFIFVTHDPRITLLSDYRLIMKKGAISKIIITSEEEKKAVQKISIVDDLLLELRNLLRSGEKISEKFITEQIQTI